MSKDELDDYFYAPASDLIYYHRRRDIYNNHAVVLRNITLILASIFFGMLVFAYDETTIWRWYVLAVQATAYLLWVAFSVAEFRCLSKAMRAVHEIEADND